MVAEVAKEEESEDGDNDGDGVFKPLSNPKKDSKKPKMDPVKAPDAVYYANNSMNGRTTESIAFPLSYGSADL